MLWLETSYGPILAQAAFSPTVGGWTSEIRVPAPLGSGESPLAMGTSLLCWHMVGRESV